MPKLNDIYDSGGTFLKADDIKGTKPIVTIETAEVVETDYGQGPKKQIVLTFVGREKKLGLNFTNASKIAELTGTEDFDEWVGVAIKLYVERVKFQDRMVDAVRIFPDLPELPPVSKKSNKKDSDEEYSGPPSFPKGAPTDEEIPW